MGLERNLGFQILREVIQCDLSNYFNTSLSIRWLRKNLMTRGGAELKSDRRRIFLPASGISASELGSSRSANAICVFRLGVIDSHPGLGCCLFLFLSCHLFPTLRLRLACRLVHQDILCQAATYDDRDITI